MRGCRRGIVLIVTLWVLTILAVLALTFAATMHVESRAALNEMQRTRARYAAHAGIQRAILAIQNDVTGFVSEEHSEWAYLDSEEDELTFPDDERYEVRVTDECGKLDLNTAEETALELLPQMSPELLACILDWRDADQEARRDGAEDDYYLRLTPPVDCADRPFLTLNELVLVKGMTKELLYGSRATRPQVIAMPDQERQSDEAIRPLLEVLTLYGGTDDLDAQGSDRVNINLAGGDDIAEAAGEALSEGDIQAILDYRGATGALSSIGDLLRIEGISREKMQQIADVFTTRSRPADAGEGDEEPMEPEEEEEEEPIIPGMPGGGGQPGGQTGGLPFAPPGGDFSRQFPQPPGGGGGRPDFPPPTSGQPSLPGQPGFPGGPEEPEEPEPAGSLPDIDTQGMPTPDQYRPGGCNINTAPPEILMTVEGMTEEVAQAIVEQRANQPFTTRGDLLNLPEATDAVFAQVAEELSVRSSALKITAIGSVEEARVRVRLTAIVDLKGDGPRIVYIAEG